jgi:AraC-like DNA-binding protein|tara:strand:+ start:3847 stop:4440 length:594 start_codon:yes stop_codon:yes gene_type:complete
VSDNPKDDLKQRALEMHNKNYKMNVIARELGVHSGTVRRWFKAMGLPPRKGGNVPHKPVVSDDPPDDQLAADIDDELNNMTNDAILCAQHDARKEEDQTMMEIAERQSTPADKYQHYIAAAGIKLLRDSVKNLRGPKTVRELSELDQLIRRNLGLNAKGGGASSMQIDISILNNTKADRGGGAISPKKVIDIDPDND